MKRHLILCALASAGFMASGSEAAVTGSLGGGTGTFLTLTTAGLNGGTVATLSGGAVLTSDQPFADIPKGGVFGGTFLAAGPTVGQPATLTFVNPVSYLSFLWGSPDTYNVLTITTNMGTQTFTAAGLGFSVTDGNQSFSQYVQFAGIGGDLIKSASFTNSPSVDAFETANFNVAAVPEPGTWAMMLLGFGGMGLAMRRRKSQQVLAIA